MPYLVFAVTVCSIPWLPAGATVPRFALLSVVLPAMLLFKIPPVPRFVFILGVILALILSRITDMLMRSVLPYAPSGGLVLIDLKLILITLAGILCIGLLSGIYPAWRAGRIRPLEAIRGEAGR